MSDFTERDISIFLQSLRGAQSTIVLTYLLMRRAMTIETLMNVTGLHHQTVRAAVVGMASKNLLYAQRGAHGKETWVPAGDTFFGAIMSQNTKISYSEPLINNNSKEGIYSEKKDLPLLINSDQPAKNSHSDKIISEIVSVKTAEEIQVCLDELHKQGIFGEKADKLSLLNWVTSEYIQDHVATAKVQNWESPLGMAIYRMETNQPVPYMDSGKANSFDEYLKNKEQ